MNHINYILLVYIKKKHFENAINYNKYKFDKENV